MLLTFCFQVELFTDLNEMKAGETIDVLEIGGGSGTNFKSVISSRKDSRNLEIALIPKLIRQVLEKECQGAGAGAKSTLCEIF